MFNYREMYHNLCRDLSTGQVRGVVELDANIDILFLLDNETPHTDGIIERIEGAVLVRNASYVIVEIGQDNRPTYDVYVTNSASYEIVTAELRQFLTQTIATYFKERDLFYGINNINIGRSNLLSSEDCIATGAS
jgi:3-oxoacyl-ACP reductase-like protein